MAVKAGKTHSLYWQLPKGQLAIDRPANYYLGLREPAGACALSWPEPAMGRG